MLRLVNRSAAIAGAIGLMFLMSSTALPNYQVHHHQAQAMGTSTQLGRSVSITLIIRSSRHPMIKTPCSKRSATGNEGLVNTLDKMH